MFIERFIRYVQFEKRFSPHTIAAYQKDLQQFTEFLNLSEVEFHEVKHTHIRSWMVEMLEGGNEPKTIHRKLSTLRSYYKFLLREKAVEFNPLLLVKPPKIPKRLPVVIDESRMDVLLDAPDIFPPGFSGLQDKLIIELLFGTGIRLAELIGLKESDINTYESTIRVLGKRNKERIIPVNETLMSAINEYLAEKKRQKFDNNSQSLIVTKEGKPVYPQLVYRTVKSYLALISTHDKKSPHVLRHSYATSLLNHGADINAIKELLGHASLAATQVYTHNSVERLKSIYKLAHPKA